MKISEHERQVEVLVDKAKVDVAEFACSRDMIEHKAGPQQVADVDHRAAPILL